MESQDPRDRRIAQLEAALAERDALIAKLMARIDVLEAEVARLKRNSTNSSKPPSSDPPGVTRQTHLPSGKKRDEQPGHEGHKRKLLPPSEVNVVVPLVPKECDHCGAGLHGRDPDPWRHQIIDIPPITPTVTEYQLHALGCDECGEMTRAELPLGVPIGAFGPRLSAMLAICTAKYRLSGSGDTHRTMAMQPASAVPISLAPAGDPAWLPAHARRPRYQEVAQCVREA